MLLDERWDRMLPPLPPHPAQTPLADTAEEISAGGSPVLPAVPAKINRRRLIRAMHRKLLADRTARKLIYDSGSSMHSAATAFECSDEQGVAPAKLSPDLQACSQTCNNNDLDDQKNYVPETITADVMTAFTKQTKTSR